MAHQESVREPSDLLAIFLGDAFRDRRMLPVNDGPRSAYAIVASERQGGGD